MDCNHGSLFGLFSQKGIDSVRFKESGLKVVADMGRNVRNDFYAWTKTMCETIDEKVDELSMRVVL